jgi:hypothetical protein
MSTLVCEKITVRCDGVPAKPVSFVWRKKEYRIAEVKHSWQDWGFSRAAPKKNWRSRRHRTYFHVLDECGRLLELYLDRANPNKPTWVLHKLLSSDGQTVGPSTRKGAS